MDVKLVEEFLNIILANILEEPEAAKIEVNTEVDDNGEFIDVLVIPSKNDTGLCIGKGGKNAQAIRTIVSLAGFKHYKKRFHVEIYSNRERNA